MGGVPRARQPRAATAATGQASRDARNRRESGSYLHPVNQWNVAARDVVVRQGPRNDVPEVTSLKSGDDVFVAARVGFTSWLRVRIRHSGRLWIGYLLEQYLLRPVALPERTESRRRMMEKSVKDVCGGLRYGHPDYVEEAKRRGLTIETCQQLGH